MRGMAVLLRIVDEERANSFQGNSSEWQGIINTAL